MKIPPATRTFSRLSATLLAAAALATADEDPHRIDDPLTAEALQLTAGFAPVAAAATTPSIHGEWGSVIPWSPHIPVTAATLPDGRLLTFSSNRRTTFPEGPEFTYAAVWDPATGAFTEINNYRHDMFCSGTAMLPDGRVVLNGGRNTTRLSSIFDFRTSEWNPIQNMNDPRWYSPSVVLPDGTVFTVSGRGGENTAELWNSVTGWRRLTGVDWAQVTSQPGYINSWHPFLMVAPNGKLLHFGPTDVMNWVTTAGPGSLTPSGQNVPGTHYPKEGAWAMYEEGRILVVGGGANTDENEFAEGTGTGATAAYTVNLNGPAPVITPTSPMAFSRQFVNSVVLPNGEVMMIGGNVNGRKFDDATSVLTPEIWNPQTGTWRNVADMAKPRNYHSVALLLPDGRVWSGGGGLGGIQQADHQDAQIFTPPSLFDAGGSQAVRPVITDGPAQLGLGSQFTVRATPGLAKFAFIRMSAVTHSVNTDLRYLSVPFTETSPGIYALTCHANPNVMMPGYWMLFGLNASDVHSVARVIQVSVNPGVTARNPGNQETLAGIPVELPLSVSAQPGIVLNYSATGLPDGLAIHSGTGLISGTITAAPGDYGVTVTVNPGAGEPVTFAFNWKVVRPVALTGRILREWWFNIYGATLADLAGNPAYPNEPDFRDFPTSLQSDSDVANDYGQRLRGYLHPTVSGAYRFWITGNEQCRLLLSTDGSSANGVEIASVPEGVPLWTFSLPEQVSTLITLEAGKRYYIEALMKEGGGGDHLAVGWLPPLAPSPELIPGQNLSPYELMNDFMATWHLDEGSWTGVGGEVRESAGTLGGIHGTAAGGALTSAAGPVVEGNPGTGRYGIFDGGGNHVRIPFHAGLNRDEFTISAWVRPPASTSAASRTVISSRQTDVAGTRGFELSASAGGAWKFSTGSPWTELTGPDVAASEWTHVAASFHTVYTSAGVRTGIRRIFLNGILVAQDIGTYVPVTSSPFLIGASETDGLPADFMTGGIDEVRVHATPLSAGEVTTVMALRHRFNFRPVITSPGALANFRNSVISQPIQANDIDGGPLVFSAAGLPGGLSISPGSGIISGTTTTAGEFGATVTATDAEGESASVGFNWSIRQDFSVTPASSPPLPHGTSVSFTATGNGGQNPRFQWNFGDGSPDTPFSSSPAATHNFPGPGRYLVTVTSTDDSGSLVSGSFHQAIHAPLTALKPSASSAICYENRVSGNSRVWVVNPDNDSVTIIDAVSRAKLAEITVGASPRCVAVAPDGRIWVTNAGSATLSILSPESLAMAETIPLPRGSRPFGLAFAPAGSAAFVTLEDGGSLLKLDPLTGAQLASTALGPNVRHLSIPADGAHVYVCRFITPQLPGEDTATVSTSGRGGEVVVVDPATGGIERTILLHHSEQMDTSVSARGIPNYLGPAAISPDGLSAWVPSKQDNIRRGKLRDNQDLTHDMSIRAIASRIDLTLQSEDLPARVDFDNAGVPNAIAFDPWGIHAFVALEASRMIAVVDVWNHREILRFDAGRAPQGLALAPDGRTLFVHNFMDRNVSIHDVGALIDGIATLPPAAIVVPAVSTEKLPPQVLLGKQLFYDAKDERLASQEYISCAACHNDGGHDGRVWDFTGFGEGLRNTISLRGQGTGQGPLHWSGNFDEVQDFENQIRNFAGGLGLISGASPHPPLGTANSGRSADLDALAAYLQSLDKHGDSPRRESTGGLTAAALAGERVFRAHDCTRCHGGPEFTLSSSGNFPDIGTLKPSSGKRLGAPLTGLDIPSLRGLWNTAPYLHDGSAATLGEAVAAHRQITIGSNDLADLTAYLESIDDQPAAAPLPTTTFAGWAEVTPGTDGNPESNADGDAFPDLLEFALGGLPDNAAVPAADAVVFEKSTGRFELKVRHPAGLRGLKWEVLTSGNLSTWNLAPAPVVESVESGRETLKFENLQNQPGITESAGYARLRVTLE